MYGMYHHSTWMFFAPLLSEKELKDSPLTLEDGEGMSVTKSE